MTFASRDRQNVWHPYTQAKTAGENVVITKGAGAYVFDEHGKAYLDAVSSWWVNLHGHAHPYIAKKIGEQAAELEQVIFAGFTHQPAILLAEKLLQLLPYCGKVFYSDNGSTAVEAALKMALQFFDNQKQPRTKVICFRDAYHGDTFGAMSVSARGVFTAPYQRLLFDVIFIDTPIPGKEETTIQQMKLAANNSVAAFIYEPLVLGSAGMLMYTSEVLDELIGICKENNILCIADEVFTGFGRTGKMFASDHCKQKPDIVCMSKGITGGFLPFAATLATNQVYDAFHHTDKSKMLFHGHSYTGNLLGCAAALASLEVFDFENTHSKINTITASQASAAHRFRENPRCSNARSCGTILAVDYFNSTNNYLHSLRDQLYQYFLEQQIILRPLGNTVYIVPPYCITEDELEKVYHAMETVKFD